MNLFSKTLQSLSTDAAAVRQVSSLARYIGVSEHNNRIDAHESPDDEIFQNLVTLDQLVGGLEEKVVALRQIVREESRSLDKFETSLQLEANDQAEVVQQLAQAIHDSEIFSATTRADEKREDELSVEGHSRRSDSSRSSRRDTLDPRQNSTFDEEAENRATFISLPRITQAELDAYKATTVIGPRMLCLINLNEVLEEIEEVCQKQLQSTQALKQKKEHVAQHQLSIGSLQRRYEYLQRRQQHSQHHEYTDGTDDVESIDAAPIITISEQDLRENCAFFRHGESTARATLAVLCSLRRLKQIPSKHRKVIYRLLIPRPGEKGNSDVPTMTTI